MIFNNAINQEGTYYKTDMLFPDRGSAEFYYSDKGEFLQRVNRYEDGENTAEYQYGCNPAQP